MTSDDRQLEINEFSAALQAAGIRLAPKAKDAEKIRLVADALGMSPATLKRWWYALNCPRGVAAKALRQMIEQVGSQDDDVIDASKID